MDLALDQCRDAVRLGVQAVMLFFVIVGDVLWLLVIVGVFWGITKHRFTLFLSD